MIPDDNKPLVPEFAATGNNTAPFPVETDEPFNYLVLNGLLVLLHGGVCLEAKGVCGPHLRCLDKCPFTNHTFAEFSKHVYICPRENCTFPYCEEIFDLFEHFNRCRANPCNRCKAPINNMVENFLEHLRDSGKESIRKEVYQVGYAFWKQLFTQTVRKNWAFQEYNQSHFFHRFPPINHKDIKRQQETEGAKVLS